MYRSSSFRYDEIMKIHVEEKIGKPFWKKHSEVDRLWNISPEIIYYLFIIC